MANVKITDYAILTPNYFIDYLQLAINQRLPGVMPDRLNAIIVTGEHPMVQLVGSIMSSGQPNFAGLLPAVSVIEGDENEEATTIGYGKRAYEQVDQAWVDEIKSKYAMMQDRVKEGIITDSQISMIESFINATTTKKIKMGVDQFYERESVFISLWTHNTAERTILGNLLRSIIYDMRMDMVGKGLKDISIRTNKGLVNFNFGRVLYGQESELSYLNNFRNLAIYDEGYSETGILNIDQRGIFEAEGHLEQKVQIYEDEEEV